MLKLVDSRITKKTRNKKEQKQEILNRLDHFFKHIDIVPVYVFEVYEQADVLMSILEYVTGRELQVKEEQTSKRYISVYKAKEKAVKVQVTDIIVPSNERKLKELIDKRFLISGTEYAVPNSLEGDLIVATIHCINMLE